MFRCTYHKVALRLPKWSKTAKTSKTTQKAALSGLVGGPTTVIIGNEQLCILSKDLTKVLRTRAGLYSWVSTLCFLARTCSRIHIRLNLAWSDELKLVNICRYFALFLTTQCIAQLRNHLNLLAKCQSNSLHRALRVSDTPISLQLISRMLLKVVEFSLTNCPYYGHFHSVSWWLVAGGWWLVAGDCWLMTVDWWLVTGDW